MLKKFLRDVVAIVLGKQSEEMADLLNTKKHISEFLIAKKLGLTVNQTRNFLYKLSDFGLVSSIRKKDKKKGWYTYFWKIEIFKSLEFLRGTLVKKMNQINYQINSRETKDFYICERCNVEFNEENALSFDFTCNECGNVFTIKNNKKLLVELKKNLNKLEKELELVDEEIKKEKEKLEKEKVKILKKEEKEKSKKKTIAVAKRKATRNLRKKITEKKSTKSKIKKKPAKKKFIRIKQIKKKIVKTKIIRKPAKKKLKKKR
jgi:transcription factor E